MSASMLIRKPAAYLPRVESKPVRASNGSPRSIALIVAVVIGAVGIAQAAPQLASIQEEETRAASLNAWQAAIQSDHAITDVVCRQLIDERISLADAISQLNASGQMPYNARNLRVMHPGFSERELTARYAMNRCCGLELDSVRSEAVQARLETEFGALFPDAAK